MESILEVVPARPRYEVGLRSLDMSRSVVSRLIDATPPDRWLSRPCANGNHLLWEVGHLTWADDFFLAPASGMAPRHADWGDLFGIGSTPRDDAAAYPAVDELRTALDERRTALRGWLAGLSDSELERQLPEPLDGFAESVADMPRSLASHEMMHIGQIMVIRKALGLERVMM